MLHPNCFLNSKEFEQWVELAEETGLPDARENYCFDCNPVFQEYAKKLHLCDKPRSFFVDFNDEDGEAFLFGVSVRD